MIKVINVITDTNIGGAGRLLINYLKNFNREKFLIKIVLPQNSLLKPEIEALGYEVIETRGGGDESLDFGAVFELMEIFKREKPDIVHTHSSMSGKIAALFAGVKSRMYTRHCAFDPPKLLTTFPGKQMNGFVNNTLSTKIIAVAEAAKENLTDTGVSEKKISVIINGVEQQRELSPEEKKAARQKYGISQDDFVMAIVARLEDIKGQKYFIDAAKLVCKRHDKVKFIVAGTGSQEAALKQQAKDLGISDKVIFTGFLDDVAELDNIMDLNINCSYGTETSSLALSEGFSLGKPAIATIYGGNPYMVTDGENGLLVPIKDAQKLADAMEKMMTDKALYEKMCRTARQHYETKFTAKAMTRALEDIYEEEYRRSRPKYPRTAGAKQEGAKQ